MLCAPCRRALFLRLSSRPLNTRPVLTRGVASGPSTPAASILAPETSPNMASGTHSLSPSPTTQTTASSPPAPKKPKSPGAAAAAAAQKIVSSVSAGTELKGLGYTKAQPKILAQEDDAYPSWLWGLLQEEKTSTGLSKVDLNAMTKKQRAKYDRKMERLSAGVVAPVPVHEQSADLTGPGDGATVSLQKRAEVTKSSRQARRKGIRERNFLNTM